MKAATKALAIKKELDRLDPVTRQSHDTRSIAGYIVMADSKDENFSVTRVPAHQYDCTLSGMDRVSIYHLIGHINVRAPLDSASPDTKLSNPFYFTSLIGVNGDDQLTPRNRKLNEEMSQLVSYIRQASLGTGLLPSIEESYINCKLSKSEWKKQSAAAKLLAYGPSAPPIVMKQDHPLSLTTKKAVAAEKKMLSGFKGQYLSGNAGDIFDLSLHTLDHMCYGFMLDLTKKLGRPCTEPELKAWVHLQIKLQGIRPATPKEVKKFKVTDAAAEAALMTRAQEQEVYQELIEEGLIERKPGVTPSSIFTSIPPTSKAEFKARMRRMMTHTRAHIPEKK